LDNNCSKLDSESKDLTFFQGQLASGENHGERRNTINLGVGHRFLIEEGAYDQNQID
jgi:hypothetical protein